MEWQTLAKTGKTFLYRIHLKEHLAEHKGRDSKTELINVSPVKVVCVGREAGTVISHCRIVTSSYYAVICNWSNQNQNSALKTKRGFPK